VSGGTTRLKLQWHPCFELLCHYKVRECLKGGHCATDMTRNSLFRVYRAGLLDRWMFFQTVTSEEQTALQFSECKKSTEGTLSAYPATATMSTGRNDVTRIKLKQLKVFSARLKRFISKDFSLFLWAFMGVGNREIICPSKCFRSESTQRIFIKFGIRECITVLARL
jgi:hypothetical protein